MLLKLNYQCKIDYYFVRCKPHGNCKANYTKKKLFYTVKIINLKRNKKQPETAGSILLYMD